MLLQGDAQGIHLSGARVEPPTDEAPNRFQNLRWAGTLARSVCWAGGGRQPDIGKLGKECGDKNINNCRAFRNSMG